MEEKYEAAKKILEKYNQEQLLSNYDKLTDDKKVELLNEILTLNFNQINELYKKINVTVDFKNSKIEPMEYTDKSTLSDDELKNYEKIGLEAIKAGKLAAVTMAGGQGTRLGHSGPKGTFMLGLPNDKSIFEIF